jgi:hypothetical protein
MFGTSWRMARIAGIDVRVDSSWVVIALLITYSMYLRFSFLYKGLSTGGAVGIAILVAVLSRRGHLVRVHRVVPGPGRPSLLPGAPGPADAAGGPGA